MEKCVKLGGGKISNHNMKKSFQLMNGDYGSREVFVYLCVGWYQAHHIWQKDYTIKTDKKVGNIKVALLSDSHVGTTFHGEGFSERMKELKNKILM